MSLHNGGDISLLCEVRCSQLFVIGMAWRVEQLLQAITDSLVFGKTKLQTPTAHYVLALIWVSFHMTCSLEDTLISCGIPSCFFLID